MLVNLKVRAANRSFWLTLIPALLLLAQVVAAPLGYTFEISGISNQLIAIVNAAFAVLTILGVVNDPTTHGFSDSTRAMSYDRPSHMSDGATIAQ